MKPTTIACLKKPDTTPKHSADALDRLLLQYPHAALMLGVNGESEVAFAELVMQKKAADPSLWVECVLACETVANDWPEPLRDRFFAVMEQCDRETMLHTQPTPGCRNDVEHYLSQHAERLFFFGTLPAA